MERQSSMASSTEEVSGANNDLSGGSRRDDEQFGVFKDFDFLEYESESVEVSASFKHVYACIVDINQLAFKIKNISFMYYRVKVQIISIGE